MLTWLVALPLAGAVVLLGLPGRKPGAIRAVATVVTAATLLIGLKLLVAFQPGLAGYQFVERAPWIPAANITYFLGVDGISLPMVLLTALLGFLACLASFGITERVKEYFVFYLLLLAGMLGTFLALDLFLFYVFWEIVLVPMYFLIGIWGGPRKEYAAIKFFLYTLAGSIFMLLAILALYLKAAPHTFSIPELVATGPALDLKLQQWLFLGFFLAFAIKVPVFPFHTWLPDAHVEAPTPISVLLAGVLLKMGGYGFFRIAFPLLPAAAQSFAGPLAALAVINILYGALVAMAQTDFKKLVAYSSVSHMGFVLLGLSAMTQTGFNGAMLQMVSHGILTGGLFLLVGVLYDRTHTRDLAAFGGLGGRVPVYGGLLMVFSLGSLGLPGLSGFVSEFLALLGAFPAHRLATALAVLGVVLTAGYILLMLQRVLLGPLNPRWQTLPEINRLELATLVPLLLLTLAIGLWPPLVLNLQSSSLDAMLRQLTGLPG
ncbi:MAG: NADH-quinone oxidoreductase subunit M [Candidatus Omnitrophica bacterium]|nr:NADH-quinone oxidoreductase subunit M [Candidatus Omnitrophota bacterium]